MSDERTHLNLENIEKLPEKQKDQILLFSILTELHYTIVMLQKSMAHFVAGERIDAIETLKISSKTSIDVSEELKKWINNSLDDGTSE